MMQLDNDSLNSSGRCLEWRAVYGERCLRLGQERSATGVDLMPAGQQVRQRGRAVGGRGRGEEEGLG